MRNDDETMDSNMDRWNDSVGKNISSQLDAPLTPTRLRGARRRASLVPSGPKDRSRSPSRSRSGSKRYGSIKSVDWENTPKRERSRKKPNYNQSLVFDDDDLSLSLDQAFSDEDEDIDESERNPALQQSGYQLSTVFPAQDAFAAEISVCSSSTGRDDVETKIEIWGREKELSTLQNRYLASCSDGSSRTEYSTHVWISGVPGIGKSSIVDAFLGNDHLYLRKPIVCRGAFKENWMDASKAFPGIMSCYNDLFQSFVDGNEREEWGERVQDCVNDKAIIALLVSQIPSLGVLLDVANENTKYSFQKTDKHLFTRLSCALGHILLLACKHSSVIFYLDDMDWATDDSLQMFKAVLLTKGLNNFFFIGSHRSGIKVSHSLHKIKAEVQELFGADIKLGGIGIKSATSLVRDELRSIDKEASIDAKMLESVIKLWYTHSSSRIPIYLKHLVHRLYEKGGFKIKKRKWILDSPKVLPSSSLSLLVERIEDLPEECDLVLKSAAMLDTNDFNRDMLMVAIAANTKSQTMEIDNESIERTLNTLSEKILIEEHSPGRYDFAHNIVKVAVSARFSVSTKRRRSGIHWRIATDLKKIKDDAINLEPETKGGFESLLIASHFNKGLLSIDDKKKIDMVVKLYLQLAEVAMKRSAFMTAASILESAVAALDKRPKWEESYGLTLKTHLAYAQSLFCSDEVEKAKPILNAIIANGRTPRDTIDAFDLLVSIYRSKMQYEQAQQFALKALSDIFDDDISFANVEEKFSKIRELVQKKSDADFLVLADLEHNKTKKEMPFLLQLTEISGLCRDFKTQDLAALRMIELTLKYGSYEANFTGLAFAYFGFCVARRHLHGEAYRYGRLAEMMSEKDNTLGRQAIACHSFDLRHWRNQMKGARKTLKDVSIVTMEKNEIENISYQVGAYLSTLLYTGTPFQDDSIINLYEEKRKQYELPGNWNVIGPYNALVKLRGENSRVMKRKFLEEKAFQYDFFFQMVESVFMNDMEKAEKMNGKISMKPRGCWVSYRLFMEGLIATHFARTLNGKNKLLYQKKASKSIEILTMWAKIGMKNSAHMANILNVDLKTASDKSVSTKRLNILFDTAISSAYHDGFPHHAALASERAGMYFVEVEDEALASKFLSRASILYAEWGAAAKVKQIDTKYGKHINSDPSQIRSLKTKNAIPSGSLMFTDRKSDKISQRTSRTTATRSRSQEPREKKTQSLHLRPRPVLSKAAKESGQQSKSGSQRRPSLVRVGSWASMTSLLSNVSEDKNSSRKGDGSRRGRRGSITNGRDKPKEEKGGFLKLKRSSSSSSISRMDSSDGSGRKKNTLASTTPNERKGNFQKFRRRNSTSSIPSFSEDNKIAPAPMTAQEEKGRFKKSKRRNSISSVPMTGVQDTNLRSSDKPQRKKKGGESDKINLSPASPKKKTFSGPVPSPGPRKAKLTLDDTFSGKDYLLDYDTDDFNTVNGDDTLEGDVSTLSLNDSDKESDDESEEESDESGIETKPKKSDKQKRTKKKSKKEKEKSPKKTKKKKKDSASEEATDLQKTPKRRTKPKVTVKSKTISL